MTRAVCHFDEPWPRPRTSRTIAFAARTAVGPAARTSSIGRFDRFVQRRLALDDLVDEPDPLGPHGVEPPAAREERPGMALADLGDDERRDHRRQDAEARLGEPESRPGLGDDEVGDRAQSHAAAERRARGRGR